MNPTLALLPVPVLFFVASIGCEVSTTVPTDRGTAAGTGLASSSAGAVNPGAFDAGTESAVAAGPTVGSGGRKNDAYVRSYDSVGTVLFTQQLGPADENRPLDAGVGSGGVMALVGVSSGNLFADGRSGRDGFIAAPDGADASSFGASAGSIDAYFHILGGDGGTRLWRRSGTPGNDTLSVVRSTPDESVAVGGIAESTLSGTSAGLHHVHVRTYAVERAIDLTRQCGTLFDVDPVVDSTGGPTNFHDTSGSVALRQLDVAGTPVILRKFSSDQDNSATRLLRC